MLKNLCQIYKAWSTNLHRCKLQTLQPHRVYCTFLETACADRCKIAKMTNLQVLPGTVSVIYQRGIMSQTS